MNPLRRLKHLAIRSGILPAGLQVRSIPRGLNRGIKFKLDFINGLQFYLGLSEKENHVWITKLCRGIATAVDVGAAYGEQTLYFALKTKADKIIVVEPDESVKADLEDNLRLNGLSFGGRIQLVSKSIGNGVSDGYLTLDEMLALEAEPIFVKIDIEGWEVEALKSGSKTLQRKDVRWLIEAHSRSLEKELLQMLTAAGYRTHIIPQGWWRCILPENRFKENRWVAAYKES